MFLPIYGLLGDKYGSKVPILAAYLLFIAGCVFTSLAPTFWLVILGRCVCGLGGAGMFSMTAIVIVENAEPADVGILRSYAGVFAILGRNIGPTIGGYITDALGWRKAFLCEIPLAVLCFVVVACFFSSEKGGDEELVREQPTQTDSVKHDSSTDFSGIGIFAVVTTALVLALMHVKNRSGWEDPILITSTVLFVVFSVLLFLRERSIGDRAFIPLSIFNRVLGTQFLIQFSWLLAQFSVCPPTGLIF